MRRILGLVLAAGLLLGTGAAQAGAEGVRANAARVCPSYVVRNTETFAGETYRYVSRVQAIEAKRLSCSGARQLIAKSYSKYVVLRPEPGSGFSVAGWRCVYYRTFSDKGHFESRHHCSRAGGHYLSWTNYEISRRRSDRPGSLHGARPFRPDASSRVQAARARSGRWVSRQGSGWQRWWR